MCTIAGRGLLVPARIRLVRARIDNLNALDERFQ